MNEELLMRFLTRKCTKEELHDVENWISADPANAEWLFGMERVWLLKDELRYSDREEIKAAYRRFISTIQPAASQGRDRSDVRIKPAGSSRPVGFGKPSRSRNMYHVWMKYAAAVAVVFLLSVNIYQAFRNKLSDEVVANTIEVPVGQRVSITLADGSKVWLNSGSILNYPAKFDRKSRTVRLDGEGYFEVTHNENVPFIVNTGKQKITVLGTTFNVMDYSSDDYAITTLVSGSVKIQPVSETEISENEYILEPSQQAFLDKATSEVALTCINVDPDRLWVNKVYQFRDKSLLEITQRLEKFYGVKINILDEDLKNVEYTGTFQTDQQIDEILKYLDYFDQQFSYIIENDTITIFSNQSKMKSPMVKKGH